MSDTYLALGVSANKDDVHAAVARLPPSSMVGAFCHLVVDSDDQDVIHLMHSDGAGTKANVAYIAFRTTGDASWFGTLAQDSVVMNLDDMACVGAVSGFLLSNTIGRNAKLIPGSAVMTLLEGYRAFSRTMTDLGVTITLAGGETADSGDTVRTIVVDSTMYTRLARRDVIDFSRVRPGDVIVGLESCGKATYEQEWNSGIGSNGFTLARHVLLSSEYRKRFPETFAPELSETDVYRGKLHLDDMIVGTGMSVAKALLSPTRTYAPIVKQLLAEMSENIHGIIHNTGGGLTKCLKFGDGLSYVKDDLFELPPIFSAIQEMGGIGPRVMLQTFNCGHRLEIFCPPLAADRIVEIASDYGVAGKVIGVVRESESGRNSVQVTFGNEVYMFA